VITARILQHVQNAHGPRAGAVIAVPGGRCAEGRPTVATSTETVVVRMQSIDTILHSIADVLEALRLVLTAADAPELTVVKGGGKRSKPRGKLVSVRDNDV